MVRLSPIIAAIATVSPAAAAPAPASPVDAFVAFCLPGDAAANAGTILAAADAAGWQKIAADQRTAAGGDGATLRVDDNASAGETHEVCTLTLRRADPALVGSLQKRLGFAPAFDAAGSATFFARRGAHGWQDGGHSDPETFAADKAAGNAFSLMVLNAAGSQPVLMALHILPGSR